LRVQSPEVFVLGGARTPVIDYVAALKDVSAIELGAVASRAAFGRTGVRPEWVDHAVIGNVPQTSADAIYRARHVALKAGVPVDVPALTVNRLRGSEIQADVSGAQLIQLGEASLVLTLLLELRRRGSVRGPATASIGGGQGIAAIVEAVR